MILIVLFFVYPLKINKSEVKFQQNKILAKISYFLFFSVKIPIKLTIVLITMSFHCNSFISQNILSFNENLNEYPD